MQVGFIDLINCEAEEGLVFEECEDNRSPKLSPLHSYELEVLKSEIL